MGPSNTETETTAAAQQEAEAKVIAEKLVNERLGWLGVLVKLPDILSGIEEAAEGDI